MISTTLLGAAPQPWEMRLDEVEFDTTGVCVAELEDEEFDDDFDDEDFDDDFDDDFEEDFDDDLDDDDDDDEEDDGLGSAADDDDF